MDERIVALLYKVVKGEFLNYEEQDELNEWIASSPHNKAVYDEVTNPILLEKEITALSSYNKRATWKKIEAGMKPRQSQGRLVSFFRSKYGRYAAAAAVLIVLTGTYFLFINPPSSTGNVTADAEMVQQQNDIEAPSGDKAVLVLSDGRRYELDSSVNGTFAQEGDMNVIRKDGEISYTGKLSNPLEAGYNTLSTPHGGQCKLLLADGSRVWLNAASSIRYPAYFSGKKREVFVTGEAYFEVAKNGHQPFKVYVKDMAVEVLGTHFNINSYDEESTMRTTLLEGKVKVASLSADKLKTINQKILFPGQQARIDKVGKIELVSNADIDEVMAWRNGTFLFQNASIETIMRNVQRWYDVDVVYKGTISRKFFAEIPMNVPVSKFLEKLKTGWVDFKIEGRKITVIAI
jgi:transmembrane sensor